MKKRSISILLIMSMMTLTLAGCGHSAAAPADTAASNAEDAVEVMAKPETQEEAAEPEVDREAYSMPESVHGAPVVVSGDIAYFLGAREIMSLNLTTSESEVVWMEDAAYRDKHAFANTYGLLLYDNLYFVRDYDDYSSSTPIAVRELAKLNLNTREVETVATFDEGCYCTDNMYYADGILYTDCNYKNDCFEIDEKGNVIQAINRAQCEEYALAPSNYSLTAYESGMKTLFPKETYAYNGKLLLYDDEYRLVVYDPANKRSTELGGQLLGLNDTQYIMSTYNDSAYTVGLINRQTGEYKFLANMDGYYSSIGSDNDYMYCAKVNTDTGVTDIGRLSLNDGKYSVIYTVPASDNGLDIDLTILGGIIKIDNYVYTIETHDCGLYPAAINLDTNEMIVGDTYYFQSGIADVGKIVRADYAESNDDGVELVTAKSALINVDDSYAGAMKINEVMNTRMDNLIEQAKEAVPEVQSMYEEAMEYASEDGMEPYYPTYSYTETVDDIDYVKDDIICFTVNGYTYLGGAHGMPYMETYIFNLETGDRLSLKDFVTVSEEELKDAVTAAMNKRIQAEGPELFWEDAEQTVHERVGYDYPYAYLAEDGIVFYFEPYLLASYAQGFVDVKIPYDVLKSEDGEK